MVKKSQPKLSKSQTGELAKVEQKQQRQQKLLDTMEKRERWMKWVIIGLIVLVLLLILFLGYATDWTKGLHKDAATNTPTALDSASLPSGGTQSGASTVGGSNGSNGSNGGSSANGTTTNSGTAKETTNTSTSNTSTTTNNTTTPAGNPSSGLLSLYSDTSAGDNISQVLDQASTLEGVTKVCHTELLVQVCDFTDGVVTVTTKNLLGSGLITSVTNNL
jgi:hypothetical protein